MKEELRMSSPGPSSRRFPAAPVDTQVRIIGVMYVLAAAFCFGRAAYDAATNAPSNGGFLAFGLVVLAVMLWRALNWVRAYRLEPDAPDGPQLVIEQLAPWRRVPVPLNRLRRVDPTPGVRAIMTLNVINIGALFGWMGRANAPGIGSVLAYATRARESMLLELAPAPGTETPGRDPQAGLNLLISPRDPAALTVALQPYCAGSRASGLFAATPARPAPPDAARRQKKR
jgi:hypothetical protein